MPISATSSTAEDASANGEDSTRRRRSGPRRPPGRRRPRWRCGGAASGGGTNSCPSDLLDGVRPRGAGRNTGRATPPGFGARHELPPPPGGGNTCRERWCADRPARHAAPTPGGEGTGRVADGPAPPGPQLAQLIDVAVPGVLAVLAVIQLVADRPPGSPALLTISALAAVLPLAFRRRAPLTVTAVVMIAVVVQVVAAGGSRPRSPRFSRRWSASTPWPGRRGRSPWSPGSGWSRSG